jgi:hypothetical protein
MFTFIVSHSSGVTPSVRLSDLLRGVWEGRVDPDEYMVGIVEAFGHNAFEIPDDQQRWQL